MIRAGKELRETKRGDPDILSHARVAVRYHAMSVHRTCYTSRRRPDLTWNRMAKSSSHHHGFAGRSMEVGRARNKSPRRAAHTKVDLRSTQPLLEYLFPLKDATRRQSRSRMRRQLVEPVETIRHSAPLLILYSCFQIGGTAASTSRTSD